MSFRNNDQPLTSEQNKIKDKFSLSINSDDSDRSLITFIEQLSLIPDHASPIRQLAEKNDPMVQYFIKVASTRAERDADAAAVKARELFRNKGNRSQFSTNAPDYYPDYFMKLIKPIYENAVYGYALAGNEAVVNPMLIKYEKWLHHDLSKEKRLALEKIYKFAFEGYFNGKHYAEVAHLWKKRKGVCEKVKQVDVEILIIVAQSLAQVGEFDLVAELICKWSIFENNEMSSLGVIAAIGEGYKAGGHKFELQRLVATQLIANEVNETCPLRDKHPRKEKIFELIMNESDAEIRKSLLIDCLYKGTVLGDELWYKPDSIFEATPSIKRGVLEKVFKELIKMGVDVTKLPGCEGYAVNRWSGMPYYPSKTNLVGLWPHSAPLAERSKVGMFTEENVDDFSSGESHDEAVTTAYVRLMLTRKDHSSDEDKKSEVGGRVAMVGYRH